MAPKKETKPAATKSKSKTKPEAPKTVTVEIPADSNAIVLGLNGPNPYLRAVTPLSVIQMAVLHSYLGAIIQKNWDLLIAESQQEKKA